MSKGSKAVSLAESEGIVSELAKIAKAGKISKWDVAGSYRRKKDRIGDIDLVIRQKDFGKWASRLPALAERGQDVNIKASDGLLTSIYYQGTRIELYVAGERNYGAMLMHCTGPMELNIAQRNRAKKLGMKLNQKGLFIPTNEIDSDEVSRVKFRGTWYKNCGFDGGLPHTEMRIAGDTEADMYSALGLEYLEPEERV